MITINLDDIEGYKELSTTAEEFAYNAKDKLSKAASSLDGFVFDHAILSRRSPEYTIDALDNKKTKIVEAINSLVETIENFDKDLLDINDLCDSFIEDVEADEEEIMGILGNYSDSEFREALADSNRTTNDVTSFRPGDCDYYVSKKNATLSMEPWPTDDGDMITLPQDTYVKKLYTVSTNAGNYTAILCEYDGKMVTGFVPSGTLSETFNNYQNGESHSNLDEKFANADGYAIAKGGFRLREYPTITDYNGNETKYQVINEVPDGTRVKVVGVWQNSEQDAKTWYLVSYTKIVQTKHGPREYNFTGFADADYLDSANSEGHAYKDIREVIPVVINSDIQVLRSDTGFSNFPAGTEFKYVEETNDMYLVEFTDPDGIKARAWIGKDVASQTVPDSLSNLDDADRI